ncbi:ABC transporter ATP-binding protein [Virgibacillus flavescens]|uniref:ABC transporter ATP-binding protein n=1 Tax=Virgibacillus flavescens TaxID=1611422 RepID=UPI003D3337E0
MSFIIKNLKVETIIAISELTIPSQEVTCIVGQSGSGKSTFMRLLNNLDNPDEGEIFFQNENIQSLDPIELRRNVTMVPQSPVIYEGTVKENLLVGLKFSENEAASDAELENSLQLMRLNKGLDTVAKDLSGGEKQRLALARGLLMSAEVYLLDEPSSSLDDETASDVIKAFMKRTKELNKTVIMVTHDKKLAEQISENIIYMDNYSINNDNGGFG